MKTIDTVRSAVAYIEDHLTEKLDLEGIAGALRYSKYHLHRTFSKTVGWTIHEYIQRRQLTEAAKLLAFSRKAIIDIALLAGYENQQSFSAAFKAMYKRSPGQFREAGIFYALQLPFIFPDDIPKAEIKTADLRNRIVLAREEDTHRWMELVRLVIDGFPCLDEEEHRSTLQRYIRDEQALILQEDDKAIGIMLFSRNAGSIDFLGVHPVYRKRGIARAFLEKIMEYLAPDRESISTTTYRTGDKADRGYRKALEKLGFAEAELLTEFGYPTQKFILPLGEHKEVPDHG